MVSLYLDTPCIFFDQNAYILPRIRRSAGRVLFRFLDLLMASVRTATKKYIWQQRNPPYNNKTKIITHSLLSFSSNKTSKLYAMFFHGKGD